MVVQHQNQINPPGEKQRRGGAAGQQTAACSRARAALHMLMRKKERQAISALVNYAAQILAKPPEGSKAFAESSRPPPSAHLARPSRSWESRILLSMRQDDSLALPPKTKGALYPATSQAHPLRERFYFIPFLPCKEDFTGHLWCSENSP